ncbi:MAG: ATP adenylyltransferase [Synechococcaceae cyanobacterium]|nr:ATP adenylyltransferase [Synechococcaceae cyanobacterium]
MRAERFWQQALAVSEAARQAGALVPLGTELLRLPGADPFVVRRLTSRAPRHLRPEGPKPNPFLPWDLPLQVALLASGHVLLLNKYPVQPAHLLVISQQWRPQSGWIELADWQAVATVAGDTGGLWFFNSSSTAGASQPHRHLQLLPRRSGEASCPLSPALEAQLAGEDPWPWAYRLSPRLDPGGWADLPELYARHCRELGLGDQATDAAPRHAYNLLFDDRWFLTVRRVREHCAGFSVNGLGFAGYLLCTDHSDRGWLEQHGPWRLLAEVAAARF